MTVGIIGYGWVGKAMHKLFADASTYDTTMEYPKFYPETSKSASYGAEVIFICVPTPNNPDGSLDSSIVDECVRQCNKKSLIVIRSTVQPGTCDNLSRDGYRIVFQPEYLGESPAHPFTDMKTRPFLVIGGEPADRRQLIELYQTVYNANVSIRQVTNYEAEVIKLSENRAIAFKVAECQELYDACEKAGVDYYTVREAVYGDDPRFNLWWTFVYSDKRGFNSKCIPKDVYGWAAWAESVGYNPELTRSLLKINEKYLNNRSGY